MAEVVAGADVYAGYVEDGAAGRDMRDIYGYRVVDDVRSRI
jgi:hypothetical protein